MRQQENVVKHVGWIYTQFPEFKLSAYCKQQYYNWEETEVKVCLLQHLVLTFNIIYMTLKTRSQCFNHYICSQTIKNDFKLVPNLEWKCVTTKH
jgi:hypothetical protein